MTAPTWHAAPLVFWQAPRCPFCGSTRRHTVRSQQEGDGTHSRRTECRSCGRRYTLVIEVEDALPISGNDQVVGGYDPAT